MTFQIKYLEECCGCLCHEWSSEEGKDKKTAFGRERFWSTSNVKGADRPLVHIGNTRWVFNERNAKKKVTRCRSVARSLPPVCQTRSGRQGWSSSGSRRRKRRHNKREGEATQWHEAAPIQSNVNKICIKGYKQLEIGNFPGQLRNELFQRL